MALCITLDGEDVSVAIRTPEVTNNTYYAAKTPGVRTLMVGWQRESARTAPLSPTAATRVRLFLRMHVINFMWMLMWKNASGGAIKN